MDKIPAYLFVYGTLLDKKNEFGAYLNQNCVFYTEGRFNGVLYDIGEYPGAVHSNEGDYVYGKIFVMSNPGATLKLLDGYEGFGPDEDQPNLFLRELVVIETDKGEIESWIYLYKHAVERLEIIRSGKYL